MPQRRRLVLALLLASSSASAETVVPIPPTPPLPQPAQGVALDPPADLSNIEGKPIARVEVVLDGNV